MGGGHGTTVGYVIHEIVVVVNLIINNVETLVEILLRRISELLMLAMQIAPIAPFVLVLNMEIQVPKRTTLTDTCIYQFINRSTSKIE